MTWRASSARQSEQMSLIDIQDDHIDIPYPISHIPYPIFHIDIDIPYRYRYRHPIAHIDIRVTRYPISILSSPISILSSYDHPPYRYCHLPYRYCHLKVISISILSSCHLVDRKTISYLVTLIDIPYRYPVSISRSYVVTLLPPAPTRRCTPCGSGARPPRPSPSSSNASCN